MEKKYDIIGVMTSGIPYAQRVFEENFQDKDARLLTFYPTILTVDNYADSKNDYYGSFQKAANKFKYFKHNLHSYFDKYLKKVEEIKDEEIQDFIDNAFLGNTYKTARWNIINSLWHEEKINAWENEKVDRKYKFREERFPRFLKDEFISFISNPQERLSKKADPSRIAILCDDYRDIGKTEEYSVEDMFKLGYKDVEYWAENDYKCCFNSKEHLGKLIF